MTATAFAVALSNTLLGTVYTCYGLMTIVDMKRGWREHGFSHFGAAWIAMAFTCGPHHLDHGLHGFISGTPLWLETVPTALATYTAAIIAASLWILGPSEVFTPRIIPNLCLVVLYSSIGYVLVRTQLRNHPMTGGWSVSGVSLAAVMYTCALMHAVFALYANSGRYYLDWHSAGIDIVAVPAAAYFLWVTYALYQGWLHDWNSAPEAAIRLGTEGATPVAS